MNVRKPEKIIVFSNAHAIINNMQIKGKKLEYNISRNIITSNHPIQITTPYASWNGNQATFDVNTKHLTMKEVTTEINLSYEPQPQP